MLSPEPSTSFCDSANLKYITPISNVLPLLAEVDRAIQNTNCYHKLCVGDCMIVYSPQDKC